MEQKSKVGIISCSGEDITEGTISRLAVRTVLERLRPMQTVTICLPLFLAGNEQERDFARNYPTITVDGCAKGCARQGTEAHSGPVSAALVVSDILNGQVKLSGERSCRKLSSADLEAVELVADRIAQEVDAVLSAQGSALDQVEDYAEGVCSCARPLPVGEIAVDGRRVRIAGLPLIFEQLAGSGLQPNDASGPRLLELAKIYHPIAPTEESRFQAALVDAYRAYHAKRSQ
ncbi:MAG: putative zinc-binding protein [Chloroflexota bacterium]